MKRKREEEERVSKQVRMHRHSSVRAMALGMRSIAPMQLCKVARGIHEVQSVFGVGVHCAGSPSAVAVVFLSQAARDEACYTATFKVQGKVVRLAKSCSNQTRFNKKVQVMKRCFPKDK